MAAGDINDSLTNIPWIVLQDRQTDPSDPGVNYIAFYFKGNQLMWLPHNAVPVIGATDPTTTTGDTIYRDSGGALHRLARGSSGQVLTMNGADTVPSWQNPATPGAWASASTITVGVGGAADITFSAISGSFQHARIVGALRGVNNSASVQGQLQLNGDTGAHYDYQYEHFHSATSTNTNALAASLIYFADVPAATATAGSAVVFTMDIPLYAGTTWHKAIVSHAYCKTAETSGNLNNELCGANWRDASAITSIKLYLSTGNLAEGSTATLYLFPGS